MPSGDCNSIKVDFQSRIEREDSDENVALTLGALSEDLSYFVILSNVRMMI